MPMTKVPVQLSDFEFKTAPYAHQKTALLLSADKECFALLMDMGTGKTKVIIDTAAYLYSQGLIDAVVVVAPNGVHRNWIENEIPVHMPPHVNCKAHYYSAGGSTKQKRAWEAVFKHPGLKLFSFNVESASNKGGQKELKTCVQHGRVLFVIDEAQRIKTPGAKRTQFLVNLAKHAAFRRIMGGTPITQSPLDLYAQFKFLDPYITGYTTFTAFRSHYAEVELRKSANKDKYGRAISYEVVTQYKNIKELERRVSPYVYRVNKKECLDLPEKVYQKVYVEFAGEQERIYKQLLDKSVAVLCEEFASELPPELQGADNEQLLLFFATSKVTASNAMVKLLRLQQVLCGALPNDVGDVEFIPSNRMRILEELVEGIAGKVIIWARFRYDLHMITSNLRKAYGDANVVEFHGGVKQDARMPAVYRFQNDSTCRFFVAQQQSGGTGLTLTAASDVIYYSNNFSLEDRLQSEDRAHRIGQKNNVTYHDLLVRGTVDEKILQALMDKKQSADSFNWHADDRGVLVQGEKEKTLLSPYAKAALRTTGINFEDDAWR